ncbi:MAG: hypothetical protein G01um101429_837 [Parcubacteria group bacterium Gr01-1014_29]|nr:MAG: hypothetical protein G01um101429_837 [Parcubacteria group bacterium Gr01-1014_29]
MPRNKKFTSDNRDALEILRDAFTDVETPHVAELGTRAMKARTVAEDPYREKVSDEDRLNQRKEAGIKRQAGKAKKRNPYDSSEETGELATFWSEPPEPKIEGEEAKPEEIQLDQPPSPPLEQSKPPLSETPLQEKPQRRSPKITRDPSSVHELRKETARKTIDIGLLDQLHQRIKNMESAELPPEDRAKLEAIREKYEKKIKEATAGPSEWEKQNEGGPDVSEQPLQTEKDIKTYAEELATQIINPSTAETEVEVTQKRRKGSSSGNQPSSSPDATKDKESAITREKREAEIEIRAQHLVEMVANRPTTERKKTNIEMWAENVRNQAQSDEENLLVDEVKKRAIKIVESQTQPSPAFAELPPSPPELVGQEPVEKVLRQERRNQAIYDKLTAPDQQPAESESPEDGARVEQYKQFLAQREVEHYQNDITKMEGRMSQLYAEKTKNGKPDLEAIDRLHRAIEIAKASRSATKTPEEKGTQSHTPIEDELGRWESEGGATPLEKAPDLGGVEAQLEENLAKVNGETSGEKKETEPKQVLTQEETDAILASAPKEEPSKITRDEDKKSEKTRAAKAWTEWTAKETEKEKQQVVVDKKTKGAHKAAMRSPQPLSPEDLPKGKEEAREDHIKTFEEKTAALEKTIIENGGTREEKDEHIARRTAQKYGYDLAKMTGQLAWLQKPENKTSNVLKIQYLETACQLVKTEIGETPPVEAPSAPEANEKMGMLGPLGSAEFKKSITDGLEAIEKDYKAGKITPEVYADLKAKYTGILEIMTSTAAEAAPVGEKKIESPEVKKNIDNLLQGRFLDNEQIRALAAQVIKARAAMMTAYPSILANRKRAWFLKRAEQIRIGGEAPEEVTYENTLKNLISTMEQTHRSELAGKGLTEKQVRADVVRLVTGTLFPEKQLTQELRERAAPESWTGTFAKWGQRYAAIYEKPFRAMGLSEAKVQKYGKNLRILGTASLMTVGAGSLYLGLAGSGLAVYGGKRLAMSAMSTTLMGPAYAFIAKGSDRLTRRGVARIEKEVQKGLLAEKETKERLDSVTEHLFKQNNKIDRKIAKKFVNEKRWKWAGIIGTAACIGLASSEALGNVEDIAGVRSSTVDQINLERRALDQALHQKAFANADELYRLKHAGGVHPSGSAGPVLPEAVPRGGSVPAEVLTDARGTTKMDSEGLVSSEIGGPMSKGDVVFPDVESAAKIPSDTLISSEIGGHMDKGDVVFPHVEDAGTDVLIMENLKKFYDASTEGKAAIIEHNSNMYNTTRGFVSSGAMTEDQWRYAWTHSELFDRVHAGDRILIEDTPGGEVFHVIPDSKLPLGAKALEALTGDGKKLTPVIEHAVDKNLGKPSVSAALNHAAEQISTRPAADLADEISKTELAGGKTLAEAFQTEATADTFAKRTLPQQEAYLHTVEDSLAKLRQAIETSDPSVQSSYEPLAANTEKLLADLRANTSYIENTKAWHQLESRLGSEAGLTRGQFETIANNWTVGKYMKFDEHSLVGNDPTHGSLEYAMQTNGRAIHEHLTTYIEGKIGVVAEQLQQDVRRMKLGEFLKLSIAK